MTYTVAGRQYVAIASGGNILSFALPAKQALGYAGIAFYGESGLVTTAPRSIVPSIPKPEHQASAHQLHAEASAQYTALAKLSTTWLHPRNSTASCRPTRHSWRMRT